MRTLTDAEAAWAAGLFEGEGCIHITGRTPVLILSMSDRDVMERWVAIMGTGRLNPITKRAEHHKQMWRWTRSGYDFTYSFYIQLGPYLGKRRVTKLLDVISTARP